MILDERTSSDCFDPHVCSSNDVVGISGEVVSSPVSLHSLE